MKATASSVAGNWGADLAINGIQDGSEYDDMFHSAGEDNYPWLAIDLGFYYKVFSCVIKCFSIFL